MRMLLRSFLKNVCRFECVRVCMPFFARVLRACVRAHVRVRVRVHNFVYSQTHAHQIIIRRW